MSGVRAGYTEKRNGDGSAVTATIASIPSRALVVNALPTTPPFGEGQVFFDTNRRIHFVGIGGIGMSGIAEVLLNLGYQVSGSDLAESETTRRLAALGAEISYGHHAETVTSATDVVVISSAVKYANPEVARARELTIPVIPRAEMLAELMRLKYGIAVAGTHGKTTTTSLVAAVLAQAHLDPTMVIGGKLNVLGSNARLGQGRFLVAEADESDGTFLLLNPTIVVVTNIDPEHLDFYGDMERVKAAYLDFINRVPFYGRAILCLDSVNVRALLPHVRKRFVTYGLSPEAEFTARNLQVTGLTTYCEVWHGEEALGELCLNLPGRHYALNALAVIAVSRELGIPFAHVQEALSNFAGIQRRFEVKGEVSGVLVIDDYAHHPEEIRATLRAAREGVAHNGERRVVALFQPHRYTRTRDLFDEFLSAFDDADVLVLTEIYAAGEDPIAQVSGEMLYRALKKRGHAEVHFAPTKEELLATTANLLQSGDVVMTLGAGDIHRSGMALLDHLHQGGLRAS
ncbi:MAG: UDP-N-acetylmuramate--L-alanine ligase [Deltaproteobacteria bacterium]|nr:UDP-N-acetylmuramate--L-alanine ligase [Deltaproteobacteria bacterium]